MNSHNMVDTSRHHNNTFPEYNGEQLLNADFKLTGKITSDIEEFLTLKLQELNDFYTTAVRNKHLDSRHNSSVYTGTCGAVFLAQKLSASKWKHITFYQETLLECAVLRKKRFTFLCGDSGPLVLRALRCDKVQDTEGTKKNVKELLKLTSQSSEREMCNEVLYGRAGYLYALLYAKQQINSDLIPRTVIQQVVNDIIGAGVDGRRRNPSSSLPLYYEWHEKEYIGAAHGYVGILYMLLQAAHLCPGVLDETNKTIILGCLDGLLEQRFPSGNMRSSMGSQSDRLLHWCHGAPGAVHLYALAYKLFAKPAYLDACKGFADAVWTRGLLRKGYGLCHGVAGNGYAMLCMYQLTGQEWSTCGEV